MENPSLASGDVLIYLGSSTHLSYLDAVLLSLCPILTALGTLVSVSVKNVSRKVDFIEAKEVPDYLTNMNGDNVGDDEKKVSNKELLKKYNADRYREFRSFQEREERLAIFRLAFIGFILGLVVALYFVGAINESITAVARILALCVLLGYQAPNIWAVQEVILSDAVEKRLKDLGVKTAPEKKVDAPKSLTG